MSEVVGVGLLFGGLLLLVVFMIPVGWHILLFLPALALLVLNLAWMGMTTALLSTRFRDIPQVVASLLQVIFFVTPIMWSVNSLPSRPAFVHWNPFYHLLEIVRAPLLGQVPPTESWIVAMAMLAVGAPISVLLYRRSYSRVPFWL